MILFYVSNIEWDTDGEQHGLNLPLETTVECESEEDVADALSDRYGFCIFSLSVSTVPPL